MPCSFCQSHIFSSFSLLLHIQFYLLLSILLLFVINYVNSKSTVPVVSSAGSSSSPCFASFACFLPTKFTRSSYFCFIIYHIPRLHQSACLNACLQIFSSLRRTHCGCTQVAGRGVDKGSGGKKRDQWREAMWITLIRLHGGSLRYILLETIKAAPTGILSLRIRSLCLLSRIITQLCNSSNLCGVFHYLLLWFSVISVVSSQNRQLMLIINSSQQ